MAVHGYSASTWQVSGESLTLFAGWCHERGIERPAEVTRDLLERFQRWLFHYRRGNGRPLALSTQHQRLVRLRSFFQWLAREHYLAADPASGLTVPRLPPRLPTDAFSVAEVEQILASIELTDPAGLRDRAMLETLYATGIRRSELVGLDLYDLDRERAWLTVRHGKGGRQRVVPLGERALAWVLRYLEDARPALLARAEEWALFVSNLGTRYLPQPLGARIGRLIRASGVRVRGGACHLFRHTCATLMLDGGADIRFIQELLGHVELGTTQIYTRVSIAKLDAVHRAAHPGRRSHAERLDSADSDPQDVENATAEGLGPRGDAAGGP
jgi:integrase/recombinase XerD